MNESLVRRLSALLRKTQANGCTKEEAEAAAAAAQRIAIENNMDLAEVSRLGGGGKPQFDVGEENVKAARANTRRPHHAWVFRVLMECFSVRVIYYGQSARATIIGEKTDAALAAALWGYLEPLFPSLYKKTADRYGLRDTAANRNGFYIGLCEGIIAMNRKIRAEAPNAYALVVADKSAAVANYMASNYADVPGARSRSIGADFLARTLGKVEGGRIKFGAQLEGGKRMSTPDNHADALVRIKELEDALRKIRALKPVDMDGYCYFSSRMGLEPEDVFEICDKALAPKDGGLEPVTLSGRVHSYGETTRDGETVAGVIIDTGEEALRNLPENILGKAVMVEVIP